MVDVRNLKKYFPVKGGFIQHTLGYVQAVDDISFTIQRGKVLGLVGESGCGKSTAGRTILGLTPATEGQVLIDGVDVCTATGDAMHTLRKKNADNFSGSLFLSGSADDRIRSDRRRAGGA